MSDVRQNEYWGRISDLMQPRDPDEDEEINRMTCGVLGHDWPDEDGQPCERCGKPSSMHKAPAADARYVAEREALIPIAEAAATAYADGCQRTPEEWEEEWVRKFHETMDVLAHALHIAGSLDAPVHPRRP